MYRLHHSVAIHELHFLLQDFVQCGCNRVAWAEHFCISFFVRFGTLGVHVQTM